MSEAKEGHKVVSQIFVSYAHEDGDFAQKVISELQNAKFELWVDSEKLRAGRDWRAGIDRGIRESFVVIVIMTPEAKASEYVTYEWAFALAIDIPVIPLLVKPTQLHPRLEVLQYLDFTKNQKWNLLVSQLLEYQSEHTLNQKVRVALLQSTEDQSQYLLDTYSKARKIPDYNTFSFLKDVLGWSIELPKISSAELIKLRGEPIITLDEWRRKRPRTIEEDRREKAGNALSAEWGFDSKALPQKIVFQIRNISEQNLLIKKIKFVNIHNSFADGDIDRSYIRILTYPVLAENIQIPARDVWKVDMILTRQWALEEINRLRNKLGYLNLEVIYEGFETEVICAV